MAGRGRGATLPAWMTKEPAAQPPPPPPPPPALTEPAVEGSAPGQFSDAPQPSGSDGGRGGGEDRDKEKRGDRRRSRSRSRDRDRDRDRNRDRRGARDRSRSRSRSRSRDRDRRRGRRDGSSDRYGERRGGSDRDRDRDNRDGGRRKGPSPIPEYDWKSRSTTGATSNFDVQPVPGAEPPTIGVVGGATASFHGGGNGGGDSSSGARKQRADTSSSTRHARRVYVGNIPKGTRNSEVEDFINKIIIDGLGADSLDLPSSGNPVLSMSILPDKQFGFCEFATVQLGFAAVNCLDGVLFSSTTSGGRPQSLKISWTNDFDQQKVGNVGLIPRIEVPPELQRGGGGGGGYGGGGYGGGGTGAGGGGRSDNSKVGPDGVRRGPVPEGPGKIFIGGLPYNLGEDEVLQVLKSFGQVSHFHLVLDKETGTSKGYAFASYQDDSMLTATNAAVTNLNGIQLGEKSMTVKIANSQGGGGPPPSSNQQHQQHQYQKPPPQAPYGSQAPPAVTAYGGAPQQAYGAPSIPPGGAGMYAPPQAGYGQPAHHAPYTQPPGQTYAPVPTQPGVSAAVGYGVPYGAPPSAAPAAALYGAGAAMYGAPAVAAPGAASYGSYGGAPGGSRVLKMSNMVTSEEIQNDSEYADIMEDVRLECSDHGAVIRVLIPRRKENYPAHAEGNIFVEFTNVDGASAAKRALTGRKFDNRTVVVEDFDENAYRQGVF